MPGIAASFVFIFLAALPGRTTFLMMLLAARGAPGQVLTGALLAFGVQAGISVGLGSLVHLLPPWAIHAGTGLLFAFFAVRFWRESAKPVSGSAEPVSWRSAFAVIFAAEWGDVSQVAIAAVAAQRADKVVVFFEAAGALCLIAVLAVFLGSRLGRAVGAKRIQRVAAGGFAIMALYLLFLAASGT